MAPNKGVGTVMGAYQSGQSISKAIIESVRIGSVPGKNYSTVSQRCLCCQAVKHFILMHVT